jgi:cytochrome c556
MRRSVVAAAAVGLIVAAAAPLGVAQEKATGIVAYRQAVMKANGAHAQALQLALTEQQQLIPDAAYHAAAVEQSMSQVPDLFPDGSTAASNALPPVWDDPAGFKAAAEKAADLAGLLADALESGDATASLAAFQALGKEGCGGCHETFRKKPS